MKVQPTMLDAYNLFHEGVLAFQRAEEAGMRVDVKYSETKLKFIEKRIGLYQKKFLETKFGRQWQYIYKDKYNLQSDAQLRHLLYKVKKVEPPSETAGGEGSTSAEALNQIDIDGLEHLIKVRKMNTVKNRLSELLREQVNGYVHPSLNLHFTRTYRPSTDKPNLANIPKRDEEQKKLVRNALYPRPGHQLLEVDFSGIEVMISACYHKDDKFIYDITQGDMHSDMTKQIFMLDPYRKLIQSEGLKKIPEFKYLRNATKNSFIFPQFYGDYYKGNAASFTRWLRLPHGKWKKGQGVKMPEGHHIADHFINRGITSYERFEDHLHTIEEDFWNNRFAKYGKWRETWHKKYQKQGYFDTLTGFRCSGVMRRNEVINYPVQGSAFHCLLWSFIQIDKIAKAEDWRSRLVNQIYDSMILDVHPDELEHVAKTIKQVTTVDLQNNWRWIIVPLEVEADLAPVDGSWAEKESYKLN